MELATSLVDSMKVEVVTSNDDILKILHIKPLSYKESIKKAFRRIEQNAIVSSWKDIIGLYDCFLVHPEQILHYFLNIKKGDSCQHDFNASASMPAPVNTGEIAMS